MNAPKRILICLGAILVLAGSTYVKVQATKKLSGKTVQIGNPTAKGAIVAFGHMIPYENWFLPSEW